MDAAGVPEGHGAIVESLRFRSDLGSWGTDKH